MKSRQNEDEVSPKKRYHGIAPKPVLWYIFSIGTRTSLTITLFQDGIIIGI